MHHAHKAVTLQGVIKVLHAKGYFADVLSRVSIDTKNALEQPQSKRFHPGSALDETLTIVASLHGNEAVEQVMANVTEGSFKGIAGPLARVFMTMLGGGPGPILSRYETMISSATQGFTARWEVSSPKAGTLIIGADDPLPPVADHAWKGAVDYLLVFADVNGTVMVNARAPGSRELRLSVQWS